MLTTRRRFMTQASTITLPMIAPRAGRAAGRRLIAGIMGCGGRGTVLAGYFARRDDVTIKYICDVDQTRFPRIASTIEDITGEIPKRVTDFRRMLEDSDVDIIVNATPNHWHGPGTVYACQAGKHVYVEKPVSHNLWEGRKMVEAARKYKCVVQGGMQDRSGEYLYQAEDYIQSGKIGQVHQVRCVEMLNRRWEWYNVQKPIPDGLDWDMYCGPAPLIPFPSTRMNRLVWDFTVGPIFNDAIHHVDIARWVLGLKYPEAVHCTGGTYVQKDDRETPDSILYTWEYPDLLYTLRGSLQTPYIQIAPYEHESVAGAIPTHGEFPDWLFNSTRIEIYGTEGMMLIGRHGGGWQVFGPDGGLVASIPGRMQTDQHIQNFLDCIRNGGLPVCDIEAAHISTALGHIGNISYRLGKRQLRFDGASERFTKDNEANLMLKRTYREPWVIHEEV